MAAVSIIEILVMRINKVLLILNGLFFKIKNR